MPWLPRKLFKSWPEVTTPLTSTEVRKMYELGFAGCAFSQEAVDSFKDLFEFPNGDEAAQRFGLADSGAGQLVIPYVFAMEMFPGCLPGPAQGRGDCVSWSTKNAILTTMCCDIVAGTPDQKTGKPEGKPDVPAEAIPEGVLSTEALYWYRGHGGEGWFCPEAASVACTKSGLWIRQNYPDIGIDLTRYNSDTAGKWGRQSPPESIKQIGRQQLAHQATEASTAEAIRDLLFNGYGCSTCGGEGYSDTRDANGVSVQKGSWAHAMACIGVDDRDIAKQQYGEPLMLIMNSWGKWNRGPRDIMASSSLVPAAKKQLWESAGIVNPTTGNIMIPEGAFWAKWSNVKRREFIHFSGVNGWPTKFLPLDWMF
jgi:hypothetical protein